MRQTANAIEYRVWDIPTRLFHWILVLAVAILLLTGLLLGDPWYRVHVYSGYLVATLLVFRVVWWFFGTGYSRLSALLRAIGHLPSFVPALLRLRPPHYAGHNPAGSVMIILLMLCLASLAASGFTVEGGEEKRGALAGLLSFATGNSAHQLHKWLAYGLMALIAVHVAGVAFETVMQHMPLVRGMVTGKLPITPGMPGWDTRPAKPLAAALVIGALGFALTYLIAQLIVLPPLGVPPKAVNATYETECSACHIAFPSTLLPRASWQKLMTSLGDHFGEDASLEPELAAEIEAYLVQNAPHGDGTSLRITEQRWFRHEHDFPDRVWQRPEIRSRANCEACHRNAAQGSYEDD